MNHLDLERCREALALAAPELTTRIIATQGGRLRSSGNWPRLDFVKTKTVQYAYLLPAGDSAELRLFPGDTLTQARFLYRDAGRVEALLRLRQKGWEITPNMHFGFATRGLAWMTATADVEQYANYWLEAIPDTRELDRREWSAFVEALLVRGFASPGDNEEFNKAFTMTNRQKASPRPGLQVVKPLSARLDQTAQLSREVAAALREVLGTLREPIVGDRLDR
jgi:hypothetical protein